MNINSTFLITMPALKTKDLLKQEFLLFYKCSPPC